MNPTPTNIPTPRTDAAIERYIQRPVTNSEANFLDFSRTLERENVTLMENEVKHFQHDVNQCNKIAVLTQQRDELKAEVERLKHELANLTKKDFL